MTSSCANGVVASGRSTWRRTGGGDGLTHVVLRAGDYVRHVDERVADNYALVEEASADKQ